MANVPKTNPQSGEHPEAAFTQEQGRVVEDITCAALEKLGYPVVGRQVVLPDDYFVTGHIDGMIADESYQAGDEPKLGFEHKHFGRYQYIEIFKRGLEDAAPELISQISLYGDALGWDSCLVVITSQDASGIKGERTQALRAKDKVKKDGTPYKVQEWALRDDFNAKVQIFEVDLAPYKKTLVPLLRERAEWLSKEGRNNPAMVLREHNPWQDNFPCGYCEWKTQCLSDGTGEMEAPILPWML